MWRRTFGAVFVCVLTFAGCGESSSDTASPTPSASDEVAGSPAVWTLAPDTSLTADSTTFTAMVSRLECSGGETGEVWSPDVEFGAQRIIVTFHAAPLPDGRYDCQGNDQVPYDVQLDEPLGDRVLFDGQCLYAAPGMGTSSCYPSGRRS